MAINSPFIWAKQPLTKVNLHVNGMHYAWNYHWMNVTWSWKWKSDRCSFEHVEVHTAYPYNFPFLIIFKCKYIHNFPGNLQNTSHNVNTVQLCTRDVFSSSLNEQWITGLIWFEVFYCHGTHFITVYGILQIAKGKRIGKQACCLYYPSPLWVAVVYHYVQYVEYM